MSGARHNSVLRNWRRARQRRAGFLAFLYASGILMLIAALAGVSLELQTGQLLASAAGTFVGAGLVGGSIAVRRIPLLAVALDLNRRFPVLQESCELLLHEKSSLTALQLLQRARVESQLRTLAGQKNRLPLATPAALVFFVTCASAAAATVLISSQLDRKMQGVELHRASPAAADSKAIGQGMQLQNAEVEVVPPRYTRLSIRRVRELQFEAAAGSVIRWHLSIIGPIRAGALVFAGGDTVALDQSPGGTLWSGQRVAVSSELYYLDLLGAGGERVRSSYFRVSVIPDEPPVIAIVAPAPRVELDHDAEPVVPFNATVADDYGIRSAHLILTLSKGDGEGVKFRDDTLRLAVPDPAAQRASIRLELNARDLGMAPGDELYYFMEAIDNRTPASNRTRSESYRIALKDTTTRSIASSDGFGVNLVPDYFRSQRQIIIDTIQLLRDRPAIALETFRDRANTLAADQKALRLRYGQFLGEEEDSGVAGVPAVPDSEPGMMPDEDDHRDETPIFLGDAEGEDDPLQDFLHDHDNAEVATLFSASIRTQLKAALSQMWDAELHLRLAEPRKALPFEYDALRLLKSVQQRSRRYVRRVGYEPPPLQPVERRLTGDLEDIESGKIVPPAPEPDGFEPVRSALALLQELLAREVMPQPKDIAKIEAGVAMLARAAVDRPAAFLEPLQTSRRFVDDLLAGEPVCRDCIPTIRAALRALLPPALPAPGPANKMQHSLMQRYLEALQEEQ